MKSKIQIMVLSVALLIASFTTSQGQTKMYKEGSVWEASFIKTKANMGIEYLNSLKANWKASHDEAVKQGLILSYKILDGSSSNPGDWDILLLVEYKNLAAMEGTDEKWDAIMKKVLGGDDAMKATNQARVNVREIYGTKLLREVIYQ